MARGAGDVSLGDGIAVREQNRGNGAVALDAHGIDRQHVGPVEEESDAAEALRLALGAIGPARQIKSGERSVRLGIAEGDQLEGKGVPGNPGNGERAVLELIVRGRERLAIERNAFERKTLAVEHERPTARRHLGVWTQPQLRSDAGRAWRQPHVELDLLDQIGRGRIVFQKFGQAGRLVHWGKMVLSPSLLEGGAKNAKSQARKFDNPTGGVSPAWSISMASWPSGRTEPKSPWSQGILNRRR